MAIPVKVVTIAQATPHNPRHSEPAMIELKDGSLMIVWQEFDGSELGADDHAPGHLSTMVSRDGGMSWGERRVLVENLPGDVNVFSPSLIRSREGDILMVFFRYNEFVPEKPPSTTAYLWRSCDEGKTFTPVSLLWSCRPLAFASGVIKRLKSGRLLMPICRQTGQVWSPTDHEVSGSAYSDDDGRSWTISDGWVDLPMRGAMEPHVAELPDGRVMMVARTQLGAVFQSISSDGGITWSKGQTTGLKAPESCPELVNLPDSDDLLIVWNNSEYDMKFGSHYGKRSPLTLAVSKDGAKTWSAPKNVVDDPKRCYTNPVIYFMRSGRCVLAWFEMGYNDKWQMFGRIDLRGAIFDRSWLDQ
ncbi:MAG: exo-alpha-sialidase [Phycisphaerales bacterium]|nr:exo-alpha-sialidase [Phycisphaerales bacterium]